MKSGIKKLIKNTLKRIPPVKNLLVRFHYLRNEQVKLLNEVNAAKMEILNIRQEIDYKYYGACGFLMGTPHILWLGCPET